MIEELSLKSYYSIAQHGDRQCSPHGAAKLLDVSAYLRQGVANIHPRRPRPLKGSAKAKRLQLKRDLELSLYVH